jgi:hypothetical protein
MRIVLEAKQDPSGIFFKDETKKTKEFKKNQLSDQAIDLSHKSVTCPSKEGVTSCIIVLGTCVQRHNMKIRYVQSTYISNVCAKR